MARLSLITSVQRRKRFVAVLRVWLDMCAAVNLVLIMMMSTLTTMCSRRPRVRSYIINTLGSREYMIRTVYSSDEKCISQLRMNRHAFFKLCAMLQTIGGLKPTRNMLVDEQVAIFLHIIAHRMKNWIIQNNFQRSGETISRYFNIVLTAVLKLQSHLFKNLEPIPSNSTDYR